MASIVEALTTELLIIGQCRGNTLISFQNREVTLDSKTGIWNYITRAYNRRFCGFDRTYTVANLQQLVQNSVDLCRLLYRSSFLQRRVPEGGGGGMAESINGMLSTPATSGNVASIELSLMSEEVGFLDEMSRAMRISLDGISSQRRHYMLTSDTKVTMQIDKIIETIEKTLLWSEPAVKSFTQQIRESNGGMPSRMVGAPLAAPSPRHFPPTADNGIYSGGGGGGVRSTSAPIAIERRRPPGGHQGQQPSSNNSYQHQHNQRPRSSSVSSNTSSNNNIRNDASREGIGAVTTAAFGNLRIQGVAAEGGEQRQQQQEEDEWNPRFSDEDNDDLTAINDLDRRPASSEPKLVAPGTSPLSAKAPAFSPGTSSIVFKAEEDGDDIINDTERVK